MSPFTREEYQAVIDTMPSEFTSHEFILALARKYQGLYISFLYDHRESDYPFQVAHGQLAKRLNEWDELEPRGEVDSTDIFGNSDRCMQWKKIT